MTLKNDTHVRMDLFYDNLSTRGKAWMNLITMICLLFYLGVMLFGSISSLGYAIETNERRFSMWNPSMIPIKALMVACIILIDPADDFACVQAYRHTAAGGHPMSYELIAILMFSSMMVLLMTGQRVFAAIGFVAAGGRPAAVRQWRR